MFTYFRSAVLAVLVAGALTSCSYISGDEPPVAPDTFSTLLVELHTWSARYEMTDSLPDGGRDSIFARYDVREDDFDRTLAYYARHPEEFDALYDGVIDSLNAVQGRLREGDFDADRSAGIDTLQ